MTKKVEVTIIHPKALKLLEILAEMELITIRDISDNESLKQGKTIKAKSSFKAKQ